VECAKSGILHFGGIRRLAYRAISASWELLDLIETSSRVYCSKSSTSIRKTHFLFAEKNYKRCIQESLALASMARDDPPASSTASSTAAAMRGKVGSEFET